MLLQRSHSGDARAADELMQLVYAELRQLAATKLGREGAAHTLQPTALVHEAWLRLGGDVQPDWRNRRHFFGAAAEAMRRILIEQARRRHAERRGGGVVPIEFDEAAVATDGSDGQTLALNDALEKLAALSPAKAELVKLRYFAGLSLEETARALEISEATASRWWTFCRAWLIEELTPPKNR